jgi:RecG-like helicase
MNQPKVNSINVSKVKDLLLYCPKEVQDYVKSLEDLYEKQEQLLIKCKQKLRDGK